MSVSDTPTCWFPTHSVLVSDTLACQFPIHLRVAFRHTHVLVSSTLLVLGETKGIIDGEPIRIYDRDRTICDVLRHMKEVDKEIFNKAIRCYVDDVQKTSLT